ncbi:MAG: hypothetical protein KKI08_01470 [Armatimonadetes bacterium]|nr:hypothetical protein [Armatimonadota bacterium]
MNATLHRQLMLALTFAACSALAATCAMGDDSDRAERERFYLESIRPTVQHLESIAPQTTDTGGIVVPTQDTYDLSTGDKLLSLRRNFTRSVVDNAAAGPLGIAFQEKLTTEAGFSLGHTALNFSQTTTDVKDVLGLSLNSKQVQVMGLTQSFGSGEGISSLGFTRTATTQALQSGAVSTVVDAVQFHSGLSKSSDLALKASRLTTDAPKGLTQTDLQAVLKLTFSGGESPLGYRQIHKYSATQDILTEQMDFAIPLKAAGGKAIAEYHSAFTTTNGVEVGQRTAHLGMPFRVAGQTWMFDHLVFGQDKGTGPVETTTTKLVSPFRLGGSTFGTEGTRIQIHQAGTDVETLQAKLTAPLLGGQATVQHQSVTTATAAGDTQVEQLAVTLPMIRLGKVAAFTGQRVSTDTVGVSDQDVTHLSMSADPIKPLHIEAQYQVDDRGPSQTLTSRQLHTKWAICDKTSLTGRFTEAEVPGAATANTLRLVEFVRDRGDNGIGLRAGIASYELPGASVANARRFEIAVGKPRTLALTAAYSEYDPNSFARLPEDGTMAFSVQHGTPDHVSVRWRYEDQPTRVEPLQAIELATKALGGSLQLSYACNPLDPAGKVVRQATQYEAALGRKLIGDINLEVGYRYLSYTQDGDVDQNIRIKLDGGKETGFGKLAVAFLTGDFAPVVTANAPAPGSLLDVSYSRKWGENGRISLSVRRQTAATPTLGDDITEGRLEFDARF